MAKKVALMVGHGKMTNGVWDCGCTYAGNTEAALMLPITKAAVKYLRQSGVMVISDADTDNNRNMVVDVAWANREKVDVYISVHCDWYKAPTGVYPLYVSSRGKKVADALNSAIKSGIPMKSRGVCRRTDLYELNATDAPACILETGSIKADLKTLKNADKYGKCIAKGICSYLGVAFKETAVTAPAKAPATTVTTLYRVRKTWADAKSQVGAYKTLANAKKIADEKGLNVYDEKGTLVYQGKKKDSVALKTNAEKINEKAIAFAWKAGTPEKVYKYPSGNPTDAFKAAWKKHFPKKKINCGCHQYVMLVLKDCGYPTMDLSSWTKILAYLKKNFTEIKVNYTQAQLRAGDIRVHKNSAGGYHIWIIAKDSNGKMVRKEANQVGNKRYAHTNTNNSGNTKKHKADWLFRAK